MKGRGFDFARRIAEGVVGVDGKPQKAFEGARLPEYQTRHSAGADFFCAEEVIVPSVWSNLWRVLKSDLKLRSFSLESDDANGIKDAKTFFAPIFAPTVVHTGIKAWMEDDEVLELYNRSSNPGKFGLVLANSVGVVDADFFENCTDDGEIRFAFYNFMPFPVKIKVGDRIGQGVFKKFLRPTENLCVKDEVRVGGVGSTGTGV